ncbi:hypothetical protein RN001_008774 [Aquatica leii]|uniref:BESS domain-containing protein n=1 Tax=Aquatica leii TaxID=1421715 RepID=A0AAN7PB39_9COLE|nr:hypothetical protein RN001_008774 [Aquatica leii]
MQSTEDGMSTNNRSDENHAHSSHGSTTFTSTITSRYGQECKHRWEAICKQYRRFLSSKKTRTEQAADPKARWKYGDILEFLHSFMKDKERLTSVTTENRSVSTINDEDTEYDTQLSEDLDASEDPQNKKEKTSKRAKSNIKVSTQAHTASGTLMKYLLEEEKIKKTEVKDELHFFFESIKATVKTFSPADKHLVKSKIFGIVSDIEAKYIHQQQHIQNFFFCFCHRLDIL